MNVFDKKLCQIFKLALGGANNKPDKWREIKYKFDRLCAQNEVVSTAPVLINAFTFIHEHGTNSPPRLETITNLRDSGFVETSSLLFIQYLNSAASVDREQMLQTSPSIASVEFWRRKNKVPKKEFQRALFEDLNKTYESAGGDWLLKHGEGQEKSRVLSLFLLRRSRPKYLQAASDALTKELLLDKKGLLLAALLRTVNSREEFKALAEIVIQKKVFRVIIESLPAIISTGNVDSNLESLFNEFSIAVITSNARTREFWSAGMAKLATAMLLNESRSSVTDSIISLISKIFQQLRLLTQEPNIKANTWVLENLTVETQTASEKLLITDEGAKHIAIAFQKAEEGYSAKDILALTARNLGLALIGQKGESVVFNPLQHEDKENGLLPGDLVLIEEIGWMCGDIVVRRAKVKRLKNE